MIIKEIKDSQFKKKLEKGNINTEWGALQSHHYEIALMYD